MQTGHSPTFEATNLSAHFLAFQVRVLNNITWTAVTEYKHTSSIGDPEVVNISARQIIDLIGVQLRLYFTKSTRDVADAI